MAALELVHSLVWSVCEEALSSVGVLSFYEIQSYDEVRFSFWRSFTGQIAVSLFQHRLSNIFTKNKVNLSLKVATFCMYVFLFFKFCIFLAVKSN